MGLFGKTQEKPPKELVRATVAAKEGVDVRGAQRSWYSDWTLRHPDWPGTAGRHFRGFPLD